MNPSPKTIFKINKTYGDKKHSINLGITGLDKLNVDQIAIDYDIDRTAEVLGRQEKPETNDPTRVAQEIQIEQIYQDAVSQYQDFVIGIIEKLDGDFEKTKHEVESNLESINMIIPNYENDNFNIKIDCDKSLKKELLDYKSAKDTYNAFRKDNKLTRPCKIKKTSDHIISFLILAFMIILESALNASFFATNLEGGLFQGGLYAFLAAVANTFLCFFISKTLIVNINHVKASVKLTGFLGILLWLGATGLIATGVSHYRDALQVAEEGAENIALDTFINTPFHLADIFSWFLFGLTIIVGIISAIDGYYYKDSYPNYEDQEDGFNKAKIKWNSFYAKVKNGFENTRSNYLASIGERIGVIENGITMLKNCYTQKQNLFNKYENARTTAEKDVKSLIVRFRNKNIEARTTKAPEYFNEPIEELDISNIPKISSSDDSINKTIIEDLEKELKQIRTSRTELEKDINKIYKEAIDIFNKEVGEL